MATLREMGRLFEVQEIIVRRMNAEPAWKKRVGKIRENKVEKALFKMKESGEIINFISSGNLSSSDIFDGIDFYIVIIDKQYKSIPISVTGPDFVNDHKVKHPDVPVISVKLSSFYLEIRTQILNIINSPL